MAATLLAAHACAPSLDDSRTPSAGSLGDAVFSAFCDRLGAGVFAEDPSGASFRAVCHLDVNGHYEDEIDETALPPPVGAGGKEARILSIAKMDALVRHRGALIGAVDSLAPDTTIPAAGGATVSLHDALLSFTQRLTALYDANPYEPAGAPLVPQLTDGLGAALGDVEASSEALSALARGSGRVGYRSREAGLGALEVLFTYPDLRRTVRGLTSVFGLEGQGAPAFEALLAATEAELATMTCDTCGGPPLVAVDGAATSRPRTTSELLSALLLSESEGNAAEDEPSRYIVRRDGRGVAVPEGNVPGVPGTVPPPFVDIDADGLADVDSFGRFIDAGGAPLSVLPPFSEASSNSSDLDEFGRPKDKTYAYVDLSRSLLGPLSRDLAALLDPTTYAGGAPDAWMVEHEALMYALAGLPVLAGERADAQFDHGTDSILGASATCSGGSRCTRYRRFSGESSPLPDLAHAIGQVLADPESDALLSALEILLRDHEDVVARLVAAGLRVKAIADEHDELAAQGLEPRAELAYATPIWDEVAAVIGKMTEHPGLIARLNDALASDVLVSPASQDPKILEATASHLGETLSSFLKHRDAFAYDPADLNGLSLNVTEGGKSISNPKNPVDRMAPLVGNNRSLFERSLQLIHDSTGVRACNRDGAKMHTTLVDWPLFGSYAECELFVFSDIGGLYLDSLLPPSHPKRATIKVAASDLDSLMNFVGAFASVDKLVEASSGIKGLTLEPTPRALNRLLFFGADSVRYGKLPDYDAKNADSETMKFISMAIDPVSSVVCPKNGKGVPTCAAKDASEVLRIRDRGTIFSWERLGFQTYLGPVVEAFASVGCNASISSCDPEDFTGEGYFLELLRALWRHWPDKDHGDYCSEQVPSTSPRYCSGAGANHYEPILAEAFLTDLVPALHDFAKVAATVDVKLERGPNAGKTVKGSAIVELLTSILFSPTRAAKLGVRTRAGASSSTWVDGTPQSQVTVFSLLADALHQMDVRFAESSLSDAEERRSKWRRARSELVDRFLTVEGSGSAARFENRAVPGMLLGVLRLAREQTNARCPNRESNGTCEWGRSELGTKLERVVSGPLFAALVDVGDAMQRDEVARREAERFLVWALTGSESPRARDVLLASTGDMLELANAEADWVPLLSASSTIARPRAAPEGPGALERSLLVLDAVTGDAIDPHHVVDAILPLLVTRTSGQAKAPLEVFADAIADVNRFDARETTPLGTIDHAFVLRTLREFLTSPTRGFPQLYAIMRERVK